ncbi:hypothetical protein BP5796_12175 [Coleophoma crateriformis]|uniref:Uncharacterized protein n=1 Tax=Coleophoma crateriformis TaxID=565419 RepID=A0A3D8QBZ4_9HELO|nr:hypothetical protein BP5796_12175 [Coleophoma crateriformis]
MELQEVAWLVRTLVSKAAVSVSLKQSADGSTIESTQTSLGHTLEETWLLDWEPRNSTHTVFGKLLVRARLASPAAVDEVVLRGRSESYEADWEGDVIELSVEGEGWDSTQVWGFTTIEGCRRYARRSVVRKGDNTKVVQVVYDWVGPNDL